MSNLALTIRSLFIRNERVSAFSIGAAMLLSVIIMGIISLTLLNEKATLGYQINRLESERQELVTDGEITDMLTLRARSMTAIEQSTVVRRMHEPERSEITYVVPITVVAQNAQ